MKSITRIEFKKREVFIALVFFLFGASLMYLYSQNQINTSRDNSYNILQNSENMLSVSRDLVGNYQSVLDLMNSCLLINPDTCNRIETADEVIQLGREREVMTEKLLKYTLESKKIFDQIRNER